MNNIMNKQPIINIGCMGSVSDGKSSMVRTLTGIRTQRHSNEQNRNITIKQGYGNMKVWVHGQDYITTDSTTENDCELVNHISFVDCPGHQELIQTMLSSIKLMDGAIFVVAVDQPLNKKPQLVQHLAAAKLGKINKIIICLNKIDLVDKKELMKRKEELDTMLREFDIHPFTIIPTSFNKRLGLNYLAEAIMKLFPPSNYLERTNEQPIFRISRTFDINKPGTNWNEVNGGVIGGSLVSGKLKVGDEIEIRPGQVSKGKDGKFVCQPIKTRVLSIKTDTCDLDEIVPGGLIGIRTDLDPFYCKNDNLAGNIAGFNGNLPEIATDIKIKTNIVTTFGMSWVPKLNDSVMIQVGTKTVEAKVIEMNGLHLKYQLTKPLCIFSDQHIIICRMVDKILKIVADGVVSN